MMVNGGGLLSKDYFKSYIKLQMNAYKCSLKEATDIAYDRLSKENKRMYGTETYHNFFAACEELRREKESL